MTYNHVHLHMLKAKTKNDSGQQMSPSRQPPILPPSPRYRAKRRLPILDESGHVATQPPRATGRRESEQIGGKIDGVKGWKSEGFFSKGWLVGK